MLTRFRADPKKIRVSISQENYTYRDKRFVVKVECLSTKRCVQGIDESPMYATMKALTLAEEHNFDGMDLYMEYSYEHPWK